MKLKYTFALIAALGLASCGNLSEYFPTKGDPAPTTSALVFGVPVGEQGSQKSLDQLTSQFADSGRGQVVDVFAGGRTFKGANTGFGAMLADSLKAGGFAGVPSIDRVLATPGDARCAQAKADKIAFHTSQSGNGPLPDAFGKIIDMDMRVAGQDSKTGNEQWTGYLELCSWIQAGETYNEYFWHIDLTYSGSDTVETVKKNDAGIFPDTLALTPEVEAMMKQWMHKLHGKKNAVKISNVWRNGTFINPAVEPNVYINDHNCFDLFLDQEGAIPPDGQLENLKTQGTLDLANQFGYCLGRCDELWMNTR